MIEIIHHDAVTEIHLDRPPVNALSLELLKNFADQFDTAIAKGTRGIILSGTPGMFSAGVDVPALLQADMTQRRAFWHEFFRVGGMLACAPVPLAAAITGHNPAGGAVLSLLCDYRVMAEGPYKMGLNEVRVGLVVPDCIQLILRRVVGTHRAERMLMSGALLDPDAALACGLIDAHTTVDQVVAHAKAWLDNVLSHPTHAMLATRHIARADLHQVWSRVDTLPIDDFFAEFQQASTQTALQAMVARLKP